MSLFWKNLKENTAKLLLWAAWLALAFVALLDLIAESAGGSVFGGKFFNVFAVLNVIGVIILIIYKGSTEQKARKNKKEETQTAAAFEPRREEEIREILQYNPGFNTLCYECIYYDSDKRHCGRKIDDQRVKEARIDEKKYCLYWEEIPQSPQDSESNF